MNRLEFYQNNKEDFIVKKHPTNDLYIVKYRHSGIDWENPYSRDARGLVLDKNSNIVSRPYPKFFNYQELKNRESLSEGVRKLSDWDDGKYYVYEKLDGSLAVVSSYRGKLIYSSTGSIYGEFPDKFEKWFKKNLNKRQMQELKKLSKNYTLMFEYVSPDNRIVVPYNKEEMIFHGMIETKSGKEIIKPAILNSIAKTLDLSVATKFDLSLDRILKLQKQSMDGNIFEGFVVKFETGKSLKIKLDEYVELHTVCTLGFGEIRTKANVLDILNLIKKDEIDDIIAMFVSRNDKHVVSFIEEIISVNDEFENLVKEALKITSHPEFTKRDYAIANGANSTLSRLVLNINNPVAIEKNRVDFTLKKMNLIN